MVAAALAVKLVELCFDVWDGRARGGSPARRRVELEELAEVLEAELQGVRVVREAAARAVVVGGISVPGLFGVVPTGEA